MNQHDRVEHALAEDEDRHAKASHVATALAEIERTLGLLAYHLELIVTDREARHELVGYLENVRRAVRRVEDDL